VFDAATSHTLNRRREENPEKIVRKVLRRLAAQEVLPLRNANGQFRNFERASSYHAYLSVEDAKWRPMGENINVVRSKRQ
jgi:hypothetical protein